LIIYTGRASFQFGIEDEYDYELYTIGTHNLDLPQIGSFGIKLKIKEFGQDWYYEKDDLKLYTNKYTYSEYDKIGPLVDSEYLFNKDGEIELWIDKIVSDKNNVFMLYWPLFELNK